MISYQEQLERRQQIIAKCNELILKAAKWQNAVIPKIGISFDLRGRAAGMAMRRGGVYTMRFNGEMLTRDAFEHILKNTVPHELAHIICYANPHLGSNHDLGWTKICLALGGSGERVHAEKVVFAKGRTFEYTTTTGHKVNVSETKHRRIQTGTTYIFRGERGKVNQFCSYRLYNPHTQQATA